MSYPNPNQYAQHYAAQQQYAQQQQMRGVIQMNQRQQQQQRAGRGGAHPPAAGYGQVPAGMMQQAQKASPRGRGTAAPLKGSVPGHGAPGMPAIGYPPGAAKVTAGASASRPEGPVDYEFLDLISEILQLVEQGFSTNSEVVKDKVNKLQEKFARAKVALERMDGAEMTPRMQEEMFDLYVIAHCSLLRLAAHSFT